MELKRAIDVVTTLADGVNLITGEILAERHIISPEAFQSFELKFMLSEDSDLYLGVRHPADMTSEEDFTALQKASMESVER